MSPRSQPRPVPFVAGIECTYLPHYDVDLSEVSGHQLRWREDLESLRNKVKAVRYPIRWHRIEAEPGRFDWSHTDRALEAQVELGLAPIVDLLHHTSYPRWLSDGFRDRRFHGAYVRFATAVAERYPWVPAYTLCNEPFLTLFLSGHEAIWPPYEHGLEGFVRLAGNLLPAIAEAADVWRERLPAARHIWVDTCEHHAGEPGDPARQAELANDRRHAVLDLMLGHDVNLDRPFLGQLVRAGGSALLELPRIQIDVLGLDYYPTTEWWYTAAGGISPSPHPAGFAALAEHYASRYDVAVMLTETNLRGTPSDRASWLRHTLEQYETAAARGVPLRGYCWYPHVDSSDWDSLLARSAGRTDPVGVYNLEGGQLRRTVFTDIWEAAARGVPAAGLPAYRFQSPLDSTLAGYLPLMAHWDWQDPPQPVAAISIPQQTRAAVSHPSGRAVPLHRATLASPAPRAMPDLVVISHLRWTWVWQRPQHLVARFARPRTGAGASVWFVEEPVQEDVTAPVIRWADAGPGVTRIWLAVPTNPSGPPTLGFDAPVAAAYGELLRDFLSCQAVTESQPAVDVLIYTPMAYDLATELKRGRLAYDVMDDLASFLDAPEGLRLRHRRLLADADVVFTGGRSLYASVSAYRRHRCYLYPSGVDTAHYASSMRLRRSHASPVAGYVGVLDERLDLGLIADLARLLPDWTIRMVGPVAKISPDSLPKAPNLEYPGQVRYEQLPAVMAGFDVALMPFALNEATRSISPTKTPEYLAAGLPVVSTRVPDVVADYGDVVALAENAVGFAAACRVAFGETSADRERRLSAVSGRQEWDRIAAEMDALIRGLPAAAAVALGEEATA